MDSQLHCLLSGTGLRFEFLTKNTIGIFGAENIGAIPLSTREISMGYERHTNKAHSKLAKGSVLALSLAGTAFAQEVPSGNSGTREIGLETIIVTAQKRQDAAQDVPISITAITGHDLISRGLNDPISLTKAVPGLSVVTTAGYGGKINYTLRGVGLNDFSNAQEAAVALYQDEIYIASSSGALLGNFDTARVEVLRGPQGTLFGRSVSGGLVQYVSNEPGDLNEGFIRAGIGSYGSHFAEGGVTAPLSERVSVRISGRYGNEDGWLRNSIGKDLNGGESSGGRVQVRVTPGDAISILLKAEHARFDSDGASGFIHTPGYIDAQGVSRRILPDQNVYGVPGGSLLGYKDQDGDFFRVAQDAPSISRTRRDILSARVEADLGGPTLTSITGLVRVRQHYIEDTDGSPDDFFRIDYLNRGEQFQQELRISDSSDNLDWMAGLFYFDYELRVPYNLTFPIGIPPFDVPTFEVRELTDLRKRSIAAYAHTKIKLAQKFDFIIGGRIERERDRFNFVEIYDPEALTEAVLGGPAVIFNSETAGDLTRVRKTYASGDIGLNYRPTSDVLTYVTLKRGIKPAGFNTPIGPLPLEVMPFKAESLVALEAGIKADMLNRRLRLNMSGFHYWYGDYQAIQFTAPIGQYTTNVEAEITGIDWEIMGLIGDHFQLGTSGTFLRARAQDIRRPTPDGVVSRDRDLPNAPRLTINGYSEFRYPLASGEASFRLDASYRSKTDFSIQNDPGPSQNGYTVFDASASWTKDNLNFSLGVTNLFNKEYESYIGDAAGFGFLLGTPGRPREVKASVTYNW